MNHQIFKRDAQCDQILNRPFSEYPVGSLIQFNNKDTIFMIGDDDGERVLVELSSGRIIRKEDAVDYYASIYVPMQPVVLVAVNVTMFKDLEGKIINAVAPMSDLWLGDD